MTVLKLEGVVTFDASDGPDGYNPEVPFVGGVSVIKSVNDTKWKGNVTVAIGDERFTGDLEAWEGMRGWSEYTPGDPAELFIKNPEGPDQRYTWDTDRKGHNLMDILWRHEEKHITMWIADEPINTLD